MFCGFRKHRGFRHHHGRQFGPWSWQGRFFERGELPVALLSLLAEGPQHGYQLMRALEEKTGGTYQASAGTIYPTLQQLQDQGFVTSHSEEGGKRVYELTDQGRAELEEKAAVVSEIWERSQQEEWGGWHHAHHPEAAEVMRPVFRVMKAAFRAARLGSSQPDRADQVREILSRARRDLDELATEK